MLFRLFNFLTKNNNAFASKRILLVHYGDAQMRGSELCLYNLIRYLSDIKYEVVLWTNHESLINLSKDYLYAYIADKFIPQFGFSCENKVNHPILGWIKQVTQARSLIKKHMPCVILCNGLAPCQWMVPASLISGTALISYHHTTYLPKERVVSFVYGVTHMVGVSEYTLLNFWSDGFPQEISSVVYNGVEDLSLQKPNRKALRDELTIAQDDFVITSLSALVEWKKIDLVIEAFRQLADPLNPPATLLIVGDGPCREMLHDKAKGLRVVFGGWRNDIAGILAASDCLVVAAEDEAFGLTIIEAASLSLPVVAVRSGGPLEIVLDRISGILVKPGSSKAISDAIDTLRNDRETCRQYGAFSRRLYEEKYQLSEMVVGVAKIIEMNCVNNHSNSNRRINRIIRIINLTFKAVIGRFKR